MPDELINQLNDSIRKNAFVEGQANVGKKVVVEGQATVGADESDEDALLSNYSDRNDYNDDDVDAEVMENRPTTYMI